MLENSLYKSFSNVTKFQMELVSKNSAHECVKTRSFVCVVVLIYVKLYAFEKDTLLLGL